MENDQDAGAEMKTMENDQDSSKQSTLTVKKKFRRESLDLIQHRLISIDILRGWDMLMLKGGTTFFSALFLLILGPTYAPILNDQFSHVAWAGFHYYDLIFPLFLFISGVSIPFSITKRLERGDKRSTLYRHIFTRAALLFLLGQLYNNLDQIFKLDIADFRWLGVLQRFAIANLVASIIVMNMPAKKQFYTMIGILLGYWAIMTLVPVPGYGAGILTPEGNLGAFIDQLLLPGRWCCYGIGGGLGYVPLGDNEGLMSSIPAVATALLGVMCGHLLRNNSFSQVKKAQYLAAGGAINLGIGVLWNFAFPIIKNIWTSSFVLFAGGWSMLLLALFFWVIDVQGYKFWRKIGFFFIPIGMNSILLYMIGVEIGDTLGFTGWLGSLVLLVSSAIGIMINWIVLYLLYHYKLFLKV
ncbi:MAG TPA: DUF5009 domain-containing protein [Candidatus Lokiarchaeia archaeon]|nr:DUF5009 domain-containing protein [Candidatus Lokiarchaeia archaeon]